jgi:twitching motility protein PilI
MGESLQRRTPLVTEGSGSPNLIARRERLREFQAELAERLRRAQNAPLSSNRLGIQIGHRRLLVNLADAGEILPVPEITPVPLTKPWYRGLANVRGNLVSVVDFSLFAGGPATVIDKDSRVLSITTDLKFATGILVSRMLGLRSAADLTPLAADEATNTGPDLFAPWLRAHLVDAQRGRWHEIDLDALVRDERFIQVARD